MQAQKKERNMAFAWTESDLHMLDAVEAVLAPFPESVSGPVPSRHARASASAECMGRKKPDSRLSGKLVILINERTGTASPGPAVIRHMTDSGTGEIWTLDSGQDSRPSVRIWTRSGPEDFSEVQQSRMVPLLPAMRVAEGISMWLDAVRNAAAMPQSDAAGFLRRTGKEVGRMARRAADDQIRRNAQKEEIDRKAPAVRQALARISDCIRKALDAERQLDGKAYTRSLVLTDTERAVRRTVSLAAERGGTLPDRIPQYIRTETAEAFGEALRRRCGMTPLRTEPCTALLHRLLDRAEAPPPNPDANGSGTDSGPEM